MKYNNEAISKFLAFTVGPNNNYITIDDLNNIDIDKKGNNFSELKNKIIDIFNSEIDSYGLIDGDKMGILLSGGMDSTLLLELLSKKFPKSLFFTYTLGYSAEDPHLPITRNIAEKYGTIHKEVIHNIQDEIFNTFDDIYSSGYELEGEDSLIMNHILSKEVKKDCKVVFSGFGLDYIFGGMDLYKNSFMEKAYNNGLLDNSYIFKKLGLNKFYLKYVLDKFSFESEDFFIKYGEYYGEILKKDLKENVKNFFYDSMKSIRDDITILKKQIFFTISTSLSNRYRPYNVPYEKQGIKHYNPFGSKNIINKIIGLNIEDHFLLNPYTLEKKYIIREIFKDLTGKNIISGLHSGTVLKYNTAIEKNKKEIYHLINNNIDFLSKYLSKDYLNVIDRVLDDSIWYENSKQIIIIMQLLYFNKYNKIEVDEKILLEVI